MLLVWFVTSAAAPFAVSGQQCKPGSEAANLYDMSHPWASLTNFHGKFLDSEHLSISIEGDQTKLEVGNLNPSNLVTTHETLTSWKNKDGSLNGYLSATQITPSYTSKLKMFDQICLLSGIALVRYHHSHGEWPKLRLNYSLCKRVDERSTTITLQDPLHYAPRPIMVEIDIVPAESDESQNASRGLLQFVDEAMGSPDGGFVDPCIPQQTIPPSHHDYVHSYDDFATSGPDCQTVFESVGSKTFGVGEDPINQAEKDAKDSEACQKLCMNPERQSANGKCNGYFFGTLSPGQTGCLVFRGAKEFEPNTENQVWQRLEKELTTKHQEYQLKHPQIEPTNQFQCHLLHENNQPGWSSQLPSSRRLSFSGGLLNLETMLRSISNDLEVSSEEYHSPKPLAVVRQFVKPKNLECFDPFYLLSVKNRRDLPFSATNEQNMCRRNAQSILTKSVENRRLADDKHESDRRLADDDGLSFSFDMEKLTSNFEDPSMHQYFTYQYFKTQRPGQPHVLPLRPCEYCELIRRLGENPLDDKHVDDVNNHFDVGTGLVDRICVDLEVPGGECYDYEHYWNTIVVVCVACIAFACLGYLLNVRYCLERAHYQLRSETHVEKWTENGWQQLKKGETGPSSLNSQQEASQLLTQAKGESQYETETFKWYFFGSWYVLGSIYGLICAHVLGQFELLQTFGVVLEQGLQWDPTLVDLFIALIYAAAGAALFVALDYRYLQQRPEWVGLK